MRRTGDDDGKSFKRLTEREKLAVFVEVRRILGNSDAFSSFEFPSVSDCAVCGLVGRSNERSPAHLHAGPDLPLLLAGSWASHRCETRPYGMFLTRHIVFSPTDNDWKMTFRYYHDPECSRPSFTLAAHGSYARAAPSPYAYDFHVSRMVLTPDDADLANALNSYKGKECGRPGSWDKGKPQDITPTGGCQAVGVRVPVVEKEILRSGVDENGGMWLALGQTATTPLQVGGLARPTSWGPQLISVGTTRRGT
ncbi:protein APCDD1-like [Penaeus chinensis]|uniref:protein APCDD1-like n=1 Tax=Penaeus chinensis TaxID=139456 RepID=UPI001FB62475|nr:protein APCDD1-like [Penaeus chinensis]